MANRFDIDDISVIARLPGLAWTRLKTGCPGVVAGWFRDTGAIAEAAFAELLSAEEHKAARPMANAEERRHFLMRRAFQRCFVADVCGWSGAVAALPMQHRRDSRPSCAVAPDLCLSFTSSGPLVLAGAARDGLLGLDIEASRPIADVAGLAARFFSAAEAAALSALPAERLAARFQRIWTVKEACLKAIGKGVVHGLDAFAVTFEAEDFAVSPAAEFANGWEWTVKPLAVPDGFIATLAHARKLADSENCS